MVQVSIGSAHRGSIALMMVLILGMLAACGGGGSTVNPPPPPPPPPPPQLDDGQVMTAQGIVEGVEEGSLLVFRGIRYAAPPTGNLRFRGPVPPASYSGVRETKTFGAKCIQPQGGTVVGEEDCLFLNIWTRNDDVIRPVMVYLHPGAANGVGGDMGSIDPAELATSEDVLVVNLNRRIAVLGHLALDELVNESPSLTAGNYAVLDVIAALEWVKANIAEFGGDPNRIMLFGTSAGGLMSCAILGAPDVAGLISAMGIQSAPCSPAILQARDDTVNFTSRFPPATATHRELLVLLGCDVAADIPACLRALPAEDIIQASLTVEFSRPWFVFAPMIDDIVVRDEPYTALANMTAGDIPVIIGVTANEVGDQFAGLDLPDDASYRSHLATLFSDPLDDDLYALYPTANYAGPKEAFEALWQDVAYSCATERLAREGVTGAPVYLFEISRGFDNGPFAGQGAYHAIDIAYIFGTFAVFGTTPDAQNLAIRDAMRAAWTGLAADPTTAPPISTDGTTLWPVFESENSTYVNFGDDVSGTTNHRDGRCAALIGVLG